MTICAAWIRNVGGCEELYFISDSRLTGNGMIWNSCKKLFKMENNCSMIAFSGNTDVGFPIIQQIETSINSYRRSRTRFMDLKDLKGHLINVINSIVEDITIELEGVLDKYDVLKDTELLFGGYSWISKCFFVWRIKYSKQFGKFMAHKVISPTSKHNYVYSGDVAYKAIKLTSSHLMEIHGKNNFHLKRNLQLDMEPLVIVRDLLLREENRTIGGPIQMMKMYQHMTITPIGILWPDVNQSRTIYGRAVLGYENTDLVYFNPFTLKNEIVPYNEKKELNENSNEGDIDNE